MTLNSNITNLNRLQVFATAADITADTVNSYTTQGVYQSYFYITNVVSGWGLLFVITKNGVTIEQVIIASTNVAIRHKENGSWSSWKKVGLS